MKILGVKQNGKFVADPSANSQAKHWWEAIKDGTPILKSLEVYRSPKTDKQLGAIFGLMLAKAKCELDHRGIDTSFIFKLENPTGIDICIEDLKQYFYTTCPIYNEEGIRITLSKSNTKEAARFFDDVRAWLASQWSIVVPEPDPDWKDKNNE